MKRKFNNLNDTASLKNNSDKVVGIAPYKSARTGVALLPDQDYGFEISSASKGLYYFKQQTDNIEAQGLYTESGKGNFTFDTVAIPYADLPQDIKDQYVDNREAYCGVPFFKVVDIQSSFGDVNYYIADARCADLDIGQIIDIDDDYYSDYLFTFDEDEIFRARNTLHGEYGYNGLEKFKVYAGNNRFIRDLIIYAIEQIDEEHYKVVGKAYSKLNAYFFIRLPEFVGMSSDYKYEGCYVNLLDKNGRLLQTVTDDDTKDGGFFLDTLYGEDYKLQMVCNREYSSAWAFNIYNWSMDGQPAVYAVDFNHNIKPEYLAKFIYDDDSVINAVFVEDEAINSISLGGTIPFDAVNLGKILTNQYLQINSSEIELYIHKHPEDLQPGQEFKFTIEKDDEPTASEFATYDEHGGFFDAYVSDVNNVTSIDCNIYQYQTTIYRKDQDSDVEFYLWEEIEHSEEYKLLHEGDLLVEKNDYVISPSNEDPEESFGGNYDFYVNYIDIGGSSFEMPYIEDSTGITTIKVLEKQEEFKTIKNRSLGSYSILIHDGSGDHIIAPGEDYQVSSLYGENFTMRLSGSMETVDSYLTGRYNGKTLDNTKTPDFFRPQSSNMWTIFAPAGMMYDSTWHFNMMESDITINLQKYVSPGKYLRNTQDSENTLTIKSPTYEQVALIVAGQSLDVSNLKYMGQSITSFYVTTGNDDKDAYITGTTVGTVEHYYDNQLAETSYTVMLGKKIKMPTDNGVQTVWSDLWNVTNLKSNETVEIEVRYGQPGPTPGNGITIQNNGDNQVVVGTKTPQYIEPYGSLNVNSGSGYVQINNAEYITGEKASYIGTYRGTHYSSLALSWGKKGALLAPDGDTTWDFEAGEGTVYIKY